MDNKKKLIITIVSNEDANQVQKNLNKESIFNTRLSTKGGFLQENNSTFIIGIDENRIEQVLSIIQKYSKTKNQLIPNHIFNEFSAYYSLPSEISVGGATIFIIDIEKFIKY
ncbi:cyclic-di-AMP receptor [Candidatus Phytoplasma sacchari]|uniref:Cyclic-di-AMP receptor n=1 Tax=Candidatus Phytoplasma sacchari TaxID=2609813 RepID=A0ABY7M4U1_9MOLU|nr:cyclic-di-AMP receptor [Candidatus Phytoplasma sacchari]KAB8122719.1 transcriptional regulator [Candidatus Phytoplasma sacchari]WBL31573.1 cyclic-di-AMP receptor [Candidatus Phytoplasma sacchari]